MRRTTTYKSPFAKALADTPYKVAAKNTAGWDEMQMFVAERTFNRGVCQAGVNRVMSRPAKIAEAPAIWLPVIGSPSQIAATTIATMGVR